MGNVQHRAAQYITNKVGITEIDFAGIIAKRFGFITGVPCSLIKNVISAWERDSQEGKMGTVFLPAPHEEYAAGLGIGYFLATGKPAALYTQNSGLCHLLEPYTSCLQPYEIPMYFIVTARGFNDSETSQPHISIGKSYKGLMKAVRLRYYQPFRGKAYAASFALNKSLKAIQRQLDSEGKCTQGHPVAYIVPPNSFKPLPDRKNDVCQNFGDLNAFLEKLEGNSLNHWQEKIRLFRDSTPMPMYEALDDIFSTLPEKALVITGNGFNARAVQEHFDRLGNFYHAGFMGGALSTGIGLALFQPYQQVVVIDGDANAQMGAAMLPFYHRMKTQGLLPNLTWVILNNGMCMSTDGQGSPALDSLFYLVADRVYKTLPPTSQEIGQRINARENEGLFPKETLNFVVKRFRRLVDAQETTLSLKHRIQGESPLPTPKLRAVD